MKKYNYRPDIDGLRAIAVISVIAFHYFPSIFSGGFIGVDIFFVISGYLITNNILINLNNQNFSLEFFYIKRIIRIFPALILVLFFSFIYGYFYSLQDDFANLGRDIAAASSFIANIVFWRVANYWNASPETQPLLHLWSLGVEEQFYLFWPIVLLIIHKKKRNYTLFFFIITVTSFILNYYIGIKSPASAFYLPITRIWELSIGGLLASYSLNEKERKENRILNFRIKSENQSIVNNLVSLVGIFFIFIGMIFNQQTNGSLNIFPIFGCLLLIYIGDSAFINRIFLSRSIFVWIGIISYPMYLWHWPILRLKNQFFGNDSIFFKILIFAATLLFSIVTFYFIEKPIQNFKNKRKVAVLLIFGLIIIGSLGYFTLIMGGFENRFINQSDRAKYILEKKKLFLSKEETTPRRDECSVFSGIEFRSIPNNCLDPGVKGTWFLWGDSFAQVLAPGLNILLPEGYNLVQITTGFCRLGIDDGVCGESNRYVLNQIQKIKPNKIIFAVRDGFENVPWEKISIILKGYGIDKFYLIGPAPLWDPSLPEIIAKYHNAKEVEKTSIGLRNYSFEVDNELNKKFVNNKSIKYISLMEKLCNQRKCLVTIPESKNLITLDYGHFSVSGSIYVADRIIRDKIFNNK